jgi:hypothetical protein
MGIWFGQMEKARKILGLDSLLRRYVEPDESEPDLTAEDAAILAKVQKAAAEDADARRQAIRNASERPLNPAEQSEHEILAQIRSALYPAQLA